MKLSVKCSSNGANLSIEVEGTQTVLELKEKISQEVDIPPAQQVSPAEPIPLLRPRLTPQPRHVPTSQRLIYSGKQLADDKTLEGYGIAAGGTIHMVLQLRGGGRI